MMSYNPTADGPSFSSAHPSEQDNYWRASNRQTPANGGVSNSNIGARINDFFSEGQRLPMYKDKPHYQSRRRRSLWRRKRVLGLVSLFTIGLLWWFGLLPSGRVGSSEPNKSATNRWSWLKSGDSGDSRVWDERRDKVTEAFKVSWDGYEKFAWGMDEYHPVSKKGRNMVEGGMGWIIVDALDTMIMMNLTSRVKHARAWISTSLNYDANHEVNTFETTIRMLGGLLSAHYLSTTFPDLAPIRDDDPNQPGEDLYIEKATDLADRILGAFESKSGIPYASVNLNTSMGIPSHADGGASSTAEAATLQLEFKYLAKLTGETHYWEKVEKVVEVIDNNHMPDGLLPIFIYPDTGSFRGENIRLGSRGDSYYEYLIKQYLQTSEGEPVYLDLWNESLEGIKKHLLTYSKRASLSVLAERQNGLSSHMTPKMDHLVCFLPGTIALGITGGATVSEAKARLGSAWTKKHDEDLQLAQELMKTCWGMYKVMETGLAPEIAYFEVDDPPRAWVPLDQNPPTSASLDDGHDRKWTNDYDIRPMDVHNLQRPETVESLFYMYRITGDAMYREWGWEMFQSFVKHTQVLDNGVPYAFTSLDDTKHIPARQRDNMESFWLAETLKYMFLLFSPDTDFPLDKVVVNTEGHFFPRFQMGKTFKTGWKRGASKEAASQETKVVQVENVNGPGGLRGGHG
jgi:endoplasmic reticulum Man9GlcNAc2 1,2-alpha-mannosidase